MNNDNDLKICIAGLNRRAGYATVNVEIRSCIVVAAVQLLVSVKNSKLELRLYILEIVVFNYFMTQRDLQILTKI